MPLGDADEPLHLRRIGIGHVPHSGMLGDELKLDALAMAADHQWGCSNGAAAVGD